MATNKAKFGTPASLTITLNGLANGAAREATKVNNSSDKYLDLQIEVTVQLAGGSPADPKAVEVYLARSLDGVVWPDVVTGANAAITPENLANLQFLGSIYFAAGSTTRSGIFDTAAGPNAALALTPYWTLIIKNNTGVAFAGSGCTARYGGLQISNE